MLLFALFTLAAVAKSQLYLTSTDDNQVQSSTSQALSYLSTGKEMYALANLQAYSVLFWLQLHSPSSSYTPILSLTTQGKEAVGVLMKSGEIKGRACSVCGQCVNLSLPGPAQAYKWVHVGVAVKCSVHTLTLVVTPWKSTKSYDSGSIESLLLTYDSKSSVLRIEAFDVSGI